MAYGLSILATRLGEDDCINCQETQQACWNTICDFAKRLTPDEKEDEYIRAWTLVFYGDVSSLPEGTTILGYEDNGQIDWSIARNRRIKRLSNPNRRAYRILDLKALYLFHESRGWKDIQIRSSRLKLKEKIREVNAVKKCTESLPNNCGDDMKKLIEETQEKLLEGYRKYNLALRVYLFFNK